ncbi:nSTAND1 domain-containing NTPase [Pseudochryseolinea flava]|uniref:High-affnity carbon uptake protein Hat/HatR n=1 Tax=Pseudochryseolinea flava TaxID=2059302 RepID=A0A364Y0C9_9BACT|nr:High-affnity carbon uptake protein Hat/HatR [Pseudochryseolinea flava]RAV99182.1 High-affnity carbon uptake protein Hat/HatR [Pseudochryseolinea flava]
MSVVIDNLVANPFPGLRPFKIEESHLFFGREGQSDEVLLKLSKNRFVGVIGPSGSGKSSFIYCGVMPILYGGFLTDASPNWEVVVTRPGGGPIDNLAEALLKNNDEYNQSDTEEKKIKRTIFSTLLRSSSLGLVEAIEQTRKDNDVNYLILVDQFEELFRFKEGHDANSINETLAFVNLLMEAVNYPDAPIYVAITMRSDFIGDCAQFPELTRKINDSHYLIPQLTRDQKRKAIEGPVAVGGANISSRLTQQLLNDLGDNPDQLPILQHALMRTWNYWANYKDFDDEPVDLKHYEAIGTMSEALSMHANEAYDELNEDQKRVCEMMFKAITEKRGENFGIRRPTKLNEVAAIADVSEEEVIAVLDKFRDPSRSLLTPGYGLPINSKSMIDISHESLMRIWVRLKNWVDDEADAVQMYSRLAEAASMHQVGKAGLWRPPDLQLALNWQAKHKPTLVWGQRYHPAFERTIIFLEYSKKEWETEQRVKELEQKRKLRRARVVALVLASAVVICLCFLLYAFYQKAQADTLLKRAQSSEAEAKRDRDKAVVAQKAAEQAQLAAEAAKNAAEEAQLAEAKQRELAEAAEKAAIANAELAKKNAAEARRNAEEAKQNALRAQNNEARAKEQEQIAIKNAQEALRQRYIAQAKAMAVKSRELNDSEQEALIAQQAFKFNSEHQGYVYDNDIYNGLYTALKKFDHPLTLSLEAHAKGAARAIVARKATNELYSAGSDGKIIRWKGEGQHWKSEVIVNSNDYQYYTIDISPDGNYLVAAGLSGGSEVNNFVELYNFNAMSSPKRIEGFSFGIENLNFTPDNKGFFARDNSGRSIRYSDLNTSKEVIHSEVKINAIHLSADGGRLAGAGEDGSLYLWDVKNNYAVTEIKSMGEYLTSVTFAPEGRRIIVGDATGIVKIYDSQSGMVIRTLSGHTSAIEQIVFNHAGSFMATASKDKTVRLWNLNRLKEQPMVLSDHKDWVWSVAFTPDDEQLLASVHSATETVKGVEHTIRAWPTKIPTMSGILCEKVKRNINKEEWEIFVGDDLPYESTCSSLPANNN